VKELRIPQDDDDEKAEKAALLIWELVKLNPDIDNSLWISACFSSIAAAFRSNNYSYEVYVRYVAETTKYYKKFWKEE
jgi:hypothetical protein